MKNSTFVIENSLGQVVRTVLTESDRSIVYRDLDTGRIAVTSSENELIENGLRFLVLADFSSADLERGPLKLEDGASIRQVEDKQPMAPLVLISSDNNEDIKQISKWTALSHALLLLLLFASSFIFSKQEEPETPVVQVYKQNFESKPNVEVSNKPIERKTVQAKVSKKANTVKVAAKNPVHKPVRTQVSVSKVGALGALGGSLNGQKGSAGFNVNATNASLGTGLKSIGSAGAGGYNRAAHGAGLVTAPTGAGASKGAGGYATRGKGGGKPGYGKMSMTGGSSGYFLPLEEEALIEGGLDKDQIATVIQRNIGQIIYCYEKGLQVAPSLAGRVSVKFVIGGNGAVSTAGIANTSLNSAKVEGCIINKLRGWQFPKPYGNVNVKVTYPFMLRRMG